MDRALSGTHARPRLLGRWWVHHRRHTPSAAVLRDPVTAAWLTTLYDARFPCGEGRGGLVRLCTAARSQLLTHLGRLPEDRWPAVAAYGRYGPHLPMFAEQGYNVARWSMLVGAYSAEIEQLHRVHRRVRLGDRYDGRPRLDRYLMELPPGTRGWADELRVQRAAHGREFRLTSIHALEWRLHRRVRRYSLARLSVEYRAGVPLTFGLQYVESGRRLRRVLPLRLANDPRATWVDDLFADLVVLDPVPTREPVRD